MSLYNVVTVHHRLKKAWVREARCISVLGQSGGQICKAKSSRPRGRGRALLPVAPSSSRASMQRKNVWSSWKASAGQRERDERVGGIGWHCTCSIHACPHASTALTTPWRSLSVFTQGLSHVLKPLPSSKSGSVALRCVGGDAGRHTTARRVRQGGLPTRLRCCAPNAAPNLDLTVSLAGSLYTAAKYSFQPLSKSICGQGMLLPAARVNSACPCAATAISVHGALLLRQRTSQHSSLSNKRPCSTPRREPR